MNSKKQKFSREREGIWSKQNAAWRDPVQVTAQWMDTDLITSEMLDYYVTGQWWDILASARITLFATREYEHLVLAMTVVDGKSLLSYMPLPHPSGIAVNISRNILHIASTRNPNIIFDFSPVVSKMERLDSYRKPIEDDNYFRTLIPHRARYYPGCFYIHDLAFVGSELHANSVGQNAIIKLSEDGNYKRVWWPHCIEKQGKPVFEINYLQLNSIAAGDTLSASFFSASTDKISSRRPGHKNFPVDRRGVLFSGATRYPIAFGLTRPHSARFYEDKVFVDNSGYGELSVIDDGKVVTIASLPGWTRGLAFQDGVAFVGTSRVIPRFRQYAPGIDMDKSICGIHAVNIKTGIILGSIVWPYGNQIFAVESVPQEMTVGFPAQLRSKRNVKKESEIYYSFSLNSKKW